MEDIMNNIIEILKNAETWSIPEIGQDIPHGDMPGDKVEIGQDHINKSKIVFRELLKKLPIVFESSESSRAVITVCGGSGVGKSEIASLISYYLNQLGIGSYTLTENNYPRRIPKYNDAERLRIFRQSGIKALVEADMLNADIFSVLREFQEKEEDADKDYIEKYPWFQTYLDGAICGLKGYLGTKNEIDFDEITDIVKQFKAGSNEIWLKRMGRTECDLWYEKVDFSKISVLVIEWTHGNSDNYEGVDIPVLLNSTPEETLEHRRSRNRDGKTDSPFTMRVLEIEQQMLNTQAPKAKIIISKSGELLTYDEYKALMAASK
jgi:alpha-galactosidase